MVVEIFYIRLSFISERIRMLTKKYIIEWNFHIKQRYYEKIELKTVRQIFK